MLVHIFLKGMQTWLRNCQKQGLQLMLTTPSVVLSNPFVHALLQTFSQAFASAKEHLARSLLK
jgi:ABC-type sulfate transport system permease subunit